MNDRLKATILEYANTCTTCGRSDCRSPEHFKAALAQRDDVPVLLPEAADSLARSLARRRGWGHTKAVAWVRRMFSVPV